MIASGDTVALVGSRTRLFLTTALSGILLREPMTMMGATYRSLNRGITPMMTIKHSYYLAGLVTAVIHWAMPPVRK